MLLCAHFGRFSGPQYARIGDIHITLYLVSRAEIFTLSAQLKGHHPGLLRTSSKENLNNCLNLETNQLRKLKLIPPCSLTKGKHPIKKMFF